MAHKTLIGGTAYALKGGKTLVGGTAYDIQRGRTLIDGTAQDVGFSPYDPVFANNDWSAIIEACKTDAVPDAWAVGDQKAMTINGTEYLIDVIGKNHDTYASGGAAPLTLMLHQAYAELSNMNSSNVTTDGWDDSRMRKTTMAEIYAVFPADVKPHIREVLKPTTAGDKSTSLITSVDRLFLLSENEVFGSVTKAAAAEGTQYPYYADAANRIKLQGSTPKHWWLRSPSVDYATSFCFVTFGGASGSRSATSQYAVSFGFCF